MTLTGSRPDRLPQAMLKLQPIREVVVVDYDAASPLRLEYTDAKTPFIEGALAEAGRDR